MLGLAWSLAHPIVLMLVYLLVFSVLLQIQTADYEHYWLFLLTGLPVWVFFATSLQSASRSLLENANLIRKVRFPRQLVPLSMVATQLVGFAVMLAIVVVLSLVYFPRRATPSGSRSRSPCSPSASSAGLSLAVASLNARLPRRRAPRRARSCCRGSSSRPCSTRSRGSRAFEDHPRLVDLVHYAQSAHARDRGHARPALLRARCRRPATPSISSVVARARARARRVRLQPRRRPRGSRSLIRPSKIAGLPVRDVGGQALVLARLEPGSSDGSSSGCAERGVAAAAGRPGRSERSRVSIEPPTAAKPSACASSTRRDQSGAGIAPATRWAVATAPSSTSGSSCAASAAAVSASSPPWTTTASRRSAIRGATTTSSWSGDEPISSNQKRNSSTRSNASR